jgi:hypothetical protein
MAHPAVPVTTARAAPAPTSAASWTTMALSTGGPLAAMKTSEAHLMDVLAEENRLATTRKKIFFSLNCKLTKKKYAQ